MLEGEPANSGAGVVRPGAVVTGDRIVVAQEGGALLAAYVVKADELLRGWLRTNGYRGAPGWPELVRSVVNAQQRPAKIDVEQPAENDGPVLAVSYAVAARLIGKSPATIGRLVAEGRLDVIGHGSGRRVTSASLERYIEEEVALHGWRAS